MTLKTGAGILLGLTLALGVRAAEMERPNVLWLTSEDNSAEWLGCYGNPLAKTPNIDRLADEGFRYTHAFANIPVCSPTRGSWITGIHALSLGIQPMRSSVRPRIISSRHCRLCRRASCGSPIGASGRRGGRSAGCCAWRRARAILLTRCHKAFPNLSIQFFPFCAQRE